MNRASELIRDCFNAIHQLRRLGDSPAVSGNHVHQRFVEYIERLLNEGPRAGMSERDAADAAYAIAALADEIAQSSPEHIRGHWYSRTLQMHFFQENIAGEGFFRRLESLRGDTRRTEVLRVYYLCLLFGFQGGYAIRGGELELVRLQESLRAELERSVRYPESLSPSGRSEDERLALGGGRRLHIVLAFGALAVAMTVYIGLRVVLDGQTGAVVDDIGAGAGR
jgi:type VI secretion system protein ImpK